MNITPEAIDEVKKTLAPVGEALKQGAEFMYEVYYRQTIIEGTIELVGSLLLSLVAAVVGVILVKKTLKLHEKAEEGKGIDRKYDRYDGGWAITAVGVTIVAIALTVAPFMANDPQDGLKKVINPHYYTIDRIIESVKNGDIK